ncbi:Nucleolar protein 58 [Perkinsus olseni]|uniref:Nucleolar protein 58 n=1 Tax=Perkinsus olseni TaxID=32597 RepID=A0A7J6LFP3_PEROL|nr:Nucleolar protein 58 [Perkinsus olseni]
MLVLLETAAGYGLFKLQKDKITASPDSVAEALSTPEGAQKAIRLDAWSAFKDNKHALEACSALIEGSMDKSLKKFLKKNIVEAGIEDELAVADLKLGSAINKKFGISCVANATTNQLMRGIREQLSTLVEGLDDKEQRTMALGLSHTLNRFKLKFSPEKVDTMIIQAVALLDDLDKELNNFAMRLREYGWHFPELSKIVTDNYSYAKVVKLLGFRTNAKKLSEEAWADIMADEQIVADIKTAAEISMGVEITEEDLGHIQELADRVLELTEYRAALSDYLHHRMEAIAPNLTYMVGELVGARLIAHAGSLMTLAKHPSSTVQILGAEKALFRALKTKQDTPKYGLIYHASLVGQTQPKFKGKISRVLAAKLSLCARVDALGDQTEVTVGEGYKEYVERRLRQLEGGSVAQATKDYSKPATQKYSKPAGGAPTYNTEADAVVEKSDETADSSSHKKKRKHEKVAEEDEEVEVDVDVVKTKKKKSKKHHHHKDAAAEEE